MPPETSPVSGGIAVRGEGGGVSVDDGSPVLDLQALLTATQAAMYTGRSVNVIVNWRNRGVGGARLPIATDPVTGEELRDRHGHPLYRLIEVAKADARALAGAEKMARTLLRAA